MKGTNLFTYRAARLCGMVLSAGMLASIPIALAVTDEDAFDEALVGFDGSGLDFRALAGLDRRVDIDRRSDFHQDVDLDEETILSAIVLARAGARDVDFESIRDITTTRRISLDARQDVDLDRGDVVSLLALGGRCGRVSVQDIADYDVDIDAVVSERQRVDLDRDDTLLAVAFARATGSRPSLWDVADVRTDSRVDVRVDRDFDLDRSNVLLALACR